MRLLKIIIFLFICSSSFSQSKGYEKSKIIDSILVKNTIDESFQLYLPKNYDSTKNSAVIFIFDPVARGKIGIEVFKEAAEKFNYILVCSNNSKNGPVDNNFEIANRIFVHIFSEFNIDSKQIYTAGFSGGSRLAISIAVLTNDIQGVIGCGAGFMSDNFQNPIPNSFSYIGLVGDEDMNYQEMHNHQKWLNKFSIDNELLTYQDGHRWPQQKQILRAFGWLELQAYKKGLRLYKEDVVIGLFNKNYRLAEDLRINNQVVLAVLEYERLLRNYSNYFKLDSIVSKVNTLKTKTSYNRKIKVIQEIADNEHKISEVFTTRFNEEAMMGRSKDDFMWWRREIKKFDDNYKDNIDYFIAKMWNRLRYSYMAMVIESSNLYIRKNKFEQGLYCDRLLVVLHPNQSRWYFRLAKSYARKNDLIHTIYNLKKAINLGYENYENIKDVEEFLKFKNKKKFERFLNSLNN